MDGNSRRLTLDDVLSMTFKAQADANFDEVFALIDEFAGASTEFHSSVTKDDAAKSNVRPLCASRVRRGVAYRGTNQSRTCDPAILPSRERRRTRGGNYQNRRCHSDRADFTPSGGATDLRCLRTSTFRGAILALNRKSLNRRRASCFTITTFLLRFGSRWQAAWRQSTGVCLRQINPGGLTEFNQSCTARISRKKAGSILSRNLSMALALSSRRKYRNTILCGADHCTRPA